jgi:hypothetical protein
MDWRRWREFMKIHDELGTHQMLRDTVVSERLYLIDRLEWLVAAIERKSHTGDEELTRLWDGDQ